MVSVDSSGSGARASSTKSSSTKTASRMTALGAILVWECRYSLTCFFRKPLQCIESRLSIVEPSLKLTICSNYCDQEEKQGWKARLNIMQGFYGLSQARLDVSIAMLSMCNKSDENRECKAQGSSERDCTYTLACTLLRLQM